MVSQANEESVESETAYHRSVDLLRAQCADSDVALLQPWSKRACEMDDTALGSGIDWGHGHGKDAPSRCHGDDQACITGDRSRQ